MSRALITADLGNSSCKLCAWVADPQPELTARAACASSRDIVAQVTAFATARGDAYLALCSVASRELEAALEEALRRALGARFLGTPECGIENATREPEQVGRDRLFAARGAFERVRGSALVIDAGTALTVDALEARPRPRFLGGAIAPGPALLADALARGTARLPHVEPGAHPPALGRDTQAALAAGIVHGFRGAARELALAVARASGLEAAPLVVTGGARGLLLDPPLFESAPLVDEDLVHRGLLYAALERLRAGAP